MPWTAPPISPLPAPPDLQADLTAVARIGAVPTMLRGVAEATGPT